MISPEKNDDSVFFRSDFVATYDLYTGDDPAFPSPSLSPSDESDDEDMDDCYIMLLVPADHAAGDMATFVLENGHEIEIEVPVGLREGAEFWADGQFSMKES